MRQIVIDTNMFLVQFKQRLDLFGDLHRLFEDESHEFVVLKQCLGELDKITLQQGVDARAARNAKEQAARLVGGQKDRIAHHSPLVRFANEFPKHRHRTLQAAGTA